MLITLIDSDLTLKELIVLLVSKVSKSQTYVLGTVSQKGRDITAVANTKTAYAVSMGCHGGYDSFNVATPLRSSPLNKHLEQECME